MSEIQPQLRDALTKLAEIRGNATADRDVRVAKDQVVKIHQQYTLAEAHLEQLLRPYKEAMEKLREYIEAQTLEYGGKVEHAGVLVKYTKGSTRRVYKVADMEKYIEFIKTDDPTTAENIANLATVTEGEPNATLVLD